MASLHSDEAWGAPSDPPTQGEAASEPEPAKEEIPTDLSTSRKVLLDMAKDKEEKWVEKSPFNYESLRQREAHNNMYAQAPRWEWNGDIGQVAPRDLELEKIIFSEDQVAPVKITGTFPGLSEIEICFYNCGKWQPLHYSTFDEIPLHPVIQDNVKLSNYFTPTPIQRACIPAILRGHDLLACAQTGSGKTAAFLIPIVSQLMGKIKQLAAPRTKPGGYRRAAEPLVLILAPTRELATQIFLEARKFCYRSFMRPCVVYGGADKRPQREELERGCDLLVATPGRLQDFMDRGNISLRRVRFSIVDEADEMLAMGFEEQIRKILHSGDHNEDDNLQILMFSATFPGGIRKLAKEFLADDYIRINVGRIGSVNPNVVQRIIYASNDKKREATYDLLSSSPAARTLIFVNSKKDADQLDDYLWNKGMPTTSIHGDRTQREREDALIAFRTGKCPILIATDIASRGLDVRNVLHVINYAVPKTLEEYTHRIGRTARIGTMGLATTFWNDREGSHLAEGLVKLLIENDQEVPSFLEAYRPADENDLAFKDENSEGEDEPGLPTPVAGDADADGSAWGGNDSAWTGNDASTTVGASKDAAAKSTKTESALGGDDTASEWTPSVW